MKKTYSILLILIAVVSVGSLSSCQFNCKRGSGKQITENRKVADFNKVDISGGYKVTLVQDSSSTVAIHADDNLMKYIETSVQNGKLRIKSKRNLCSSGEMTLVIGVRNLNAIDASGAVEITSNGRINTGDLSFDLSGSTKINMEINAANVNTGGSGSTELHLKGQAASHNVDLSGSGTIDALDFVVGKYNIETSGASHCKINVLNTLSVHTSGASEIEYRGNPSNVSNDKSGASSITKID